MIPRIVLLAALFVSIAVGSTAAILAWREGPKPGARPLSLLLVGQVWWSTSSFFRIRAPTLEEKLFWLMALWVGVVIIPLGWIQFALEYTGRDKYLQSRHLAPLLVIPIVTILLVGLGPAQDLLRAVPTGYMSNGVLNGGYTGIWFWVVAAYTYVLGGGGVLLLGELIVSRAQTFQKQGIALSVAIVIPWATNIAYLLGWFDFGLDPTPIAFSISGVIFLVAIRRFQLLSANPAPNRRGRRLVFEGMEEMAVVVDTDDHIVDINDSARAFFETPSSQLIGQSATDVIPTYPGLLERNDENEEFTTTRDGVERTYRIRSTEIEDSSGRVIGHVLTFHDVTDYVRREQRYEVLNRVFRHNLRTQAQFILGEADRLASEENEAVVESIKSHTRAITEIGDKARTVTALFGRESDTGSVIPLADAIANATKEVSNAAPQANIRIENGAEDLAVDSVIEPVLYNAIENAVEHNPNPRPSVWIDVEQRGSEVAISIADDGPGLGTHEIETLERGSESQLEHTSGLGLWLIKWGTEIAGGSVTFSEREPTGSVVTLEVPIPTRDQE
ncbi:MAG: histidine kinase N-terminal 7TM domain-containing protein [Halodesulfurarchaeum sp.]